MGDCLPKCPTGAIFFEQREAAEYDRAAVERNMRKKMTGACPGSKMRAISRNEETESKSNWPVQIKLTQIIKNNDIQSVTIVRMEVPCCGSLAMAA